LSEYALAAESAAFGASLCDQAGSRGCSMITRVLTTLAFGLGLAAAPALAASENDVVSVYVDQAKVAKLPPGTSTLVIGNPAIADVTMLKTNSVMVITGKGYGETNLIALDAQGEILDEKNVRVLPSKTALIVQRGDSNLSYNCDPLCERTLQLSDDKTPFKDMQEKIESRNGLASGSSVTQPK
jgi:Flp pilus assembly secretin CpaC